MRFFARLDRLVGFFGALGLLGLRDRLPFAIFRGKPHIIFDGASYTFHRESPITDLGSPSPDRSRGAGASHFTAYYRFRAMLVGLHS